MDVKEILEIRPSRSPDAIIRIKPPDPPLILNKSNGKFMVAKSEVVVKILSLSDGPRTLKDILGEAFTSEDPPQELIRAAWRLILKLSERGVIWLDLREMSRGSEGS